MLTAEQTEVLKELIASVGDWHLLVEQSSPLSCRVRALKTQIPLLAKKLEVFDDDYYVVEDILDLVLDKEFGSELKEIEKNLKDLQND